MTLDERLSQAQFVLRDGYHDDLSRAVAEARNLLRADELAALDQPAAPTLEHLASAMKKLLPPPLLTHVLAYLDPLTPFLAALKEPSAALDQTAAPEVPEGYYLAKKPVMRERPEFHVEPEPDDELTPDVSALRATDSASQTADRTSEHGGDKSDRAIGRDSRHDQQVAVDQTAPPSPCTDYRPDHNGECLNCDEPASEHDDDMRPAYEFDYSKSSANRFARRWALLQEIRRQYERRQEDYAKAGGDPATMQGDLTCYLPYDVLRPVFTGEHDTNQDMCVCGHRADAHGNGGHGHCGEPRCRRGGCKQFTPANAAKGGHKGGHTRPRTE